jgi:hypothetical protein
MAHSIAALKKAAMSIMGSALAAADPRGGPRSFYLLEKKRFGVLHGRRR